MIRPLAPLALGLVLAGCSGGGSSVSGTASESARSHSGLSGLWERVRGLTVDTGKSVEMPALGLIADAFASNETERRFASMVGEVLVEHADNQPVPPLDRQVEIQQQLLAAHWKDTPADFQAISGSPAYLAYELPIIAALTARKGWEVNPQAPRPEFDTPFFRAHGLNRPYDPALLRRYMESIAASAIYANDVFATIARQFEGVHLADPADAQARVRAAYHAIPPGQLRAMLAAAVAKVEDGRFTTDLTGSGNVHFINSAAGDFVSDARGTTWTRAGGVWFGDGRINGQAVTFRVASTASLAERQSQSGTAGADTGADVSGSGSVGPGK